MSAIKEKDYTLKSKGYRPEFRNLSELNIGGMPGITLSIHDFPDIVLDHSQIDRVFELAFKSRKYLRFQAHKICAKTKKVLEWRILFHKGEEAVRKKAIELLVRDTPVNFQCMNNGHTHWFEDMSRLIEHETKPILNSTAPWSRELPKSPVVADSKPADKKSHKLLRKYLLMQMLFSSQENQESNNMLLMAMLLKKKKNK